MKEYQIQKDRKRVLPSEVYYQCLWVVKDMNRLQEIAGMEFRREMLAEDVLTYGNTAMQEVRWRQRRCLNWTASTGH